MRLIRSKGVGVFFVTQSPAGFTRCSVLAQLGMRIQHGLRAFTAKEQKSLKAVADGFRPNPEINTLQALTELGIGEALYGGLEAKGTPAMVRRVVIAPPQSRLGPLTEVERVELLRTSPLLGYYRKPLIVFLLMSCLLSGLKSKSRNCQKSLLQRLKRLLRRALRVV